MKTNFYEKLYLGMIYLCLYLPIFVLIAYSFNNSKYSIEWKGFSLKWYESLFKNDSLIDAALNSLSLAFLSASAATLIVTM